MTSTPSKPFTNVPCSHPAMSAGHVEDRVESYVGRRAAASESAPSVHGDMNALRGLAARRNATRRMGKNRRSHGRGQAW